MERYKPTYMGQVMPADDPSKLTDFVANKYESFSKCYDAAKDESENIKSVSAVNSSEGTSEFKMKVTVDEETMEKIKDKVNDDESVSVNNGIISAK